MIFVGDTDETYIEKVGLEIQIKFRDLIKNGTIEIISPPQNYYPNFDEVKILNSFGDSSDRIKWRQKQNLGKILLMLLKFKT